MPDLVKITYYTDPLCCWNRAFEQHWTRLRKEFGHAFHWKYVMGGMIPDWKTYSDPLNSISRPLQMGPMWMHAAQVTHTKINYSIWHEDPPASSYPSCIAVKCAGLQSAEASDLLLYKFRDAVMLQKLNIAKSDILLEIAETLGKEQPKIFNIDTFKTDWNSGAGKEPFRSDLQQAAFHKIGRYPTLTFTNSKGEGIMIVGYRPYEDLVKAMEQVAPKQPTVV